MKSSFFRKLLFLIIFAVFSIFVIYFLFKEFSKPSLKPEFRENKTYQKQVNWQKYLPKIKELIIKNFENLPTSTEVSLEKIIDIDNDGIDEALINLSYGGAATEDYIWIKMDNGNIKIVKFKEKNGEVKEKIFTQGIGGAGRYGFNFDFLNDEKTIFQASFYAYNSPEDFCKVEAYVYNKSTNLFEYNEEKSKILTEKYCKNLCNSINDEIKEYFVNICK